jgi:hypothetical protein
MVSDRRALIVGINNYAHAAKLSGAVADGIAMAERLSRHSQGDPNYDCVLMVDEGPGAAPIARRRLRESIHDFFSPEFEGDLLFYFSGHGYLSRTGGYLVSDDGEPHDWGVPMQEVMDLARPSRAREIVVIVDVCHAGDMGNPSQVGAAGMDPLAMLREDMTVLASSRDVQTAAEAGGHGLFTAAVLDALDGGAADHQGWVSAPAVYSYVERRFGAWQQRPVYKSHATHVPVIRKCQPLIDSMKLRQLVTLFSTRDAKYQLDPEYEPEDEHGNVHEPVNHEKVAIAQLLKDYRDAGLLKTSVPGDQLFWAARRSHSVELTPRGQEYWWLVSSGKI